MANIDQIRNIVLLGHGGAGKTSLAEAILHKTGTTNRLGSVDDKTSICDYYDEEKNYTSMGKTTSLEDLEGGRPRPRLPSAHHHDGDDEPDTESHEGRPDTGEEPPCSIKIIHFYDLRLYVKRA